MRHVHNSGRNSPPIGERRVVRPKSRSRWDDKGVGGQPHNESVPKLPVDVLDSHIVKVVQQAQKIASNCGGVGATHDRASSGYAENAQCQTQLGTADTIPKGLHDDFGVQNIEMDFEAMAPAFKAPREP